MTWGSRFIAQCQGHKSVPGIFDDVLFIYSSIKPRKIHIQETIFNIHPLIITSLNHQQPVKKTNLTHFQRSQRVSLFTARNDRKSSKYSLQFRRKSPQKVGHFCSKRVLKPLFNYPNGSICKWLQICSY